MKNGTGTRGHTRGSGTRAELTMVPGRQDHPGRPDPKSGAVTAPAPQPAPPLTSMDSGIVVSEEELGTVKAQRLYKMRCECGRSWFELELPKFVECPACKKLGLVSA